MVDAEAKEWQSYLTVPVILDLRDITRRGFTYSGLKPEVALEVTQLFTMTLYRENGEVIDSIHNLLHRKWRDMLLPVEPGEYDNLELADGKIFMKAQEQLHLINVTANITVEKKFILWASSNC